MTTFAQAVDAAIDAAQAGTDFVLTRAEEEAALAPLVAKLRAMPFPQAVEYVKATHRGAGTYDALAVHLFKGAA